jgi:multidrug efflux pump subunit AcrB
LGLVLAIGLVVDDAIVVVEAVEHHIEEGLSPREASFKAMEQVASPVIAIALILAAVFIPTAFIPGITGRLYQQFAVTIAISVIFSAFNALTLTPALRLTAEAQVPEREQGTASAILCLVQPDLWPYHKWLFTWVRSADSEVGVRAHLSGSGWSRCRSSWWPSALCISAC